MIRQFLWKVEAATSNGAITFFIVTLTPFMLDAVRSAHQAKREPSTIVKVELQGECFVEKSQ